MYTVHKYFQCFLYSAILAWAINTTTALAADATSFNPVDVSVSAASSGGVPVGTVIAWPVSTNPDDFEKWLECNGQSIPTSYTALRAIVGTTTPNYQGLFLRGNGGNAAALGVQQAESVYIDSTSSNTALNIEGAKMVWSGASNYGGEVDGISGWQGVTSVSHAVIAFGETSNSMNSLVNTVIAESISTYANSSVSVDMTINTTATETRPTNKSVRYLIRALP